MRDDVLHRLAARLAHTDVDQVLDSLQRSPQLQGDLAWLDEILDAADLLMLPPVPADVSAALHSLWPKSRSTRIENTTLIHDSRSAGELVGVRGVHRSTGWTALFTAVSADIAIDGSPQDAGDTGLSGQILSRTNTGIFYDVSLSGPVNVMTRSDDVGQFDLGVVPIGQYTLVVAAPDHTLNTVLDVGP